MFISKFKLYLYPQNSKNSTSQNELVHILKKLKFIDETEESSNSALRFLSGEKFLSHLQFLGCSPDIEFHPEGDRPYIYVEIPKPYDTPRFISGINVKVPNCPNCKKELSTLPNELKTNSDSSKSVCPHCQTCLNTHKLNWRKTACLCNSSIIVNNIYESEAVPSDQLLSILEQETGFGWKYSYIRSK